ncbi:MAG: monovalent cation:H+ antiporter, family [Blastocatellia bacterium]|jgi:CPA1 family monovalent cation:H+ antiporter|nr:monovalent cation:H+ antiporter, family [Blastocatellia bacterium]
MGLSIEKMEVLLLVAAVVAMLARRLRVPYSIGLVVAGVCLALLPFAPTVQLTKQLIFTAFLPPLIFEAAINLRWSQLKPEMPLVLVLATVGVLFSAAVTALGMHYLARWVWMSALVFGVLIAATDPVAVIATFKETRVRGRSRLLVEAESLFNDCTAAVAFTIVLGFAGGQSIGVFGVAKSFLVIVVGAIVCGVVVSFLCLLLAGATDDHLIEITFTTVAAYGSFLLAEHFHTSGVLATLTAGLIIGNVGHLSIAAKSRQAVEEFWEYVAFFTNSLIFLLIGMRVAVQNFRSFLSAAFIAILLVTLGRAFAIYPVCLLFIKSKLRVSPKDQHILFWGGLRGALALALALGLPAEMAGREEIVAVAFAVVAFSILVQGLTIIPLMRRLGELAPPRESVEK